MERQGSCFLPRQIPTLFHCQSQVGQRWKLEGDTHISLDGETYALKGHTFYRMGKLLSSVHGPEN